MDRNRRLHLGREIDLRSMRPTGESLLYDPDHLTTHGVCFGMTGSGKTGLCVVLLEEAIRSGIPSLVLDLKGDLANLALTFPALAAAEFEPWVDPAEASRQGMTTAAFAAVTAERWRKGLAESGLGPADVAALRKTAEIAVFTPGSTSGRSVNLLGGFSPPPAAVMKDEEAVRWRITQSAAALLDLAGIGADPVTSPEAIFLAGSFDRSWREGRPLTLEAVIRDLSEPPVERLGVMALDDVYPRPRRAATAVALNSLVASPAFAAWTKGAPLDPEALLRAGDGRPRAAVVYLAHLTDRERSFVVATLLGSVVTWMRSQSGTSSLRALVYVDEIFGYLPPHPANPPSKEPMLTLLKQARAFGVGVLLATQNPVDVDYKGLANAGTWLLGRLQADQDRERLLEGMSAAAGVGVDRAVVERALATLPARSFLLHDAREDRLRAFTSRWAMSYLRGPLTRDEIRRLPEARSPEEPAAAARLARAAASGAAPGGARAGAGGLVARPKLPDGILERFVEPEAGGAPFSLRPHLMGCYRVVIEDPRAGVREERERRLLLPAEAATAAPDWSRGRPLEAAGAAISVAPPDGATYEAVPAAWRRAAAFRQAASSLKAWAAANESLLVFRNPAMKLSSRPGEAREAFEARCREEAARLRAEEAAALAAKVEAKARRLLARLDKEEADVARDQQDLGARRAQEIVGAGEALLGTLFGRRRAATSILGAGQRRRMTQRTAAQLERSRLEAEAARRELEALEAQARSAAVEVESRWAAAGAAIEETVLRPRKTAIEILEIGVLWTVENP